MYTLQSIYLPFQGFFHFISLLKFYNVIACTQFVLKHSVILRTAYHSSQGK